MAGLPKYSVLIGRPISHRFGEGENPHYQVHVVDKTTDYRIAINVKSKLAPSELAYYANDNFQHPMLEELGKLTMGIHKVERKAGGIALDYIRGNLFDRQKMRLLPHNLVGPDNDLNEEFNRYIQRAMADENALIYAFGERWGPEANVKDKYFGFKPGNGIHDIHMNQGNVGQFTSDDGVWQDGGLFIHMPSEERWVAIFLKFQSQSWHTDDKTGHTIVPTPGQPTTQPTTVQPTPSTTPVVPGEPDLVVRIVAALVNPKGGDQGLENVTLLNTSDQDINLKGWSIVNTVKEKHTLSGTIQSGATLAVKLPKNVPLSNNGGIITLLNKDGLKVHGVKYTKQQADRDGWSVVFT